MCTTFGWPKPTGPYPVGITAWQIADRLRPDPFAAPEAAGPRAVMVNVWYPAEAAPGARPLGGTVGFPEGGVAYPRPPITLLTRAEPLPATLRRLAARYALPGAALHQVTHLNTFALPEAAPAHGGERWPVLLFSHGHGLENTVSGSFLCEALASHGYAVLSVSHPGESLATVFPDGRISALSFDNPRLDLEARLNEIESTAGAWGPLAAHSLDVWTADLSLVLDALDRHAAPGADNPLGALAGCLDIGRVGALGAGFGGSAAEACAARNRRISAAACLGGRIAPGPTLSPECPSLLVLGEGQRVEAAATHVVRLDGARPLHFTGAALWFPLLAQLAEFDSGRVYLHYKALAAHTLQFFDWYLRGRGDPAALPAQ